MLRHGTGTPRVSRCRDPEAPTRFLRIWYGGGGQVWVRNVHACHGRTVRGRECSGHECRRVVQERPTVTTKTCVAVLPRDPSHRSTDRTSLPGYPSRTRWTWDTKDRPTGPPSTTTRLRTVCVRLDHRKLNTPWVQWRSSPHLLQPFWTLPTWKHLCTSGPLPDSTRDVWDSRTRVPVPGLFSLHHVGPKTSDSVGSPNLSCRQCLPLSCLVLSFTPVPVPKCPFGLRRSQGTHGHPLL